MPGSLSGQNIAKGELRRNFKRFILFQFASGTPSAASFTNSLLVENLSANLKALVNVAAIRPGNNTNYLANYLANPGTLQITPITNGDGNDQYAYGNTIFSSPNFSGPLPLPNGWEWASAAPKALIQVVVDSTKWAGSQAGDQIVLDFSVEYIGSWWDPEAIAAMLNKVTLTWLNNSTTSLVGSL